jgi:hypothetical protein
MPKTNQLMRHLLGAALALGVLGAPMARAQDAGAGITTLIPTDKQWERNKAMPFGMKTILLYGDPSKPGPYVYRLRVPTGYKIPPVRYPDDRVVTILKGVMWSAEGERYDPMKMKEYEAGTFFITPAGTAHYQWARTELVLQVMGFGPIDNPVTYLNPDDDPRIQ